MVRLPPSALRSTPLATLMVATLALWGCGGSSNSGTGGAGGHATGGSSGGHGGAATGGSGGHATGGEGGGILTGVGGSEAGGAGASTGAGGAGGAATGGSGGANNGGAGGAATGGGGGVGGAATGGSAGAAACTNCTACTTSGNVPGVCSSGTCQGCASDASCTASTAYGTGYICLVGSGACVQGACHDDGDCGGKICSVSHLCNACIAKVDCTSEFGDGYVCQTSTGKCIQGGCTTTADCGTGQVCSNQVCTGCGTDDSVCSATTGYGTGYICVGGGCVMGTCHTGAQCTGGQACNLSTHTCGNCAADSDCQTSYGTGYICGPSNTCIAGNCHPATADANCNGQLCVNNSCTPCTTDGQCASGKVCIGGACITGNCHDRTTCATGQVCTNNSCASCANDGQCIDAYGQYVCAGSTCKPGNCHLAGDCDATSQICNTTTLFCGACTNDTQCKNEYGGSAKQLCISNICVTGTCHDSGDCSGKICGFSHTCGICGSDTDCHNDAKYGSGYVCQGGSCVMGTCHTAQDCHDTTKICSSLQCTGCTANMDCTNAYGSNHVCDGGSCKSGTCATSADCGGSGQLCVGNSCVACSNDPQCVGDTFYGSNHICNDNGQCVSGTCHTSHDCLSTKQLCNSGTHTCVACASDTACRNDNNYGPSDICLGSVCVAGDCHDTSADCKNGQICGLTTDHTCGSCTLDSQCMGDTTYGDGDICYQSACVAGDCHGKSDDCTGTNAGRICGVTTPENCGSCTTDAQCQADPLYGPGYICHTAAGATSGTCVSAGCSTNSTVCGANSADFCCGYACAAGNCCDNSDCLNNSTFGIGYACIGNSCTHCDAIAGNTYYVDPVNGNDVSATGSGQSGGTASPACAFKTITHAMAIITAFAGNGTKLVILGTAGTTTNLDVGESYPITVQPNVTLTNSGGPVTIVLPAATNQNNPTNVSGFNLTNAGVGISGSTDPAAPLVIEGSSASGIAVAVSGASAVATLANLTIQNTRAHAVTVTGGKLTIGAGLVAANAGTQSDGAAVIARDGLDITGGVVTINAPSGSATTEFVNNSRYGILVSATGSLNVTGSATISPTPNGNGTVVLTANIGTGLLIQQTPGGAGASCSIDGLVSWGNEYGAYIYGGSKVKLRNSVLAGNSAYGLYLQRNGASGSDLSTFDFGTSAMDDPGANWFQMPRNTLGFNFNGGVCVNWGGTTATGTLEVAGNEWNAGPIGNINQQTQVNCATTSATITKNANLACGGTGAASYGKGTADTVDVAFDMCD